MIKNYTSEVPANKSVMHIEKRLVDNGAINILKLYDESKHLAGIAFIINIKGNETPFKLPARIDRVEKRLYEDIKRPRKGTLDRLKDQAERTAWKLLSDWVDIQMSLVELDQVELSERQCRCCLYWQNGVRKRLRDLCKSYIKDFFTNGCFNLIPEALGVNVFQTCYHNNISIQRAAFPIVYKIALIGTSKSGEKGEIKTV